MIKVIVDCSAGKVEYVDMTPEEEAEIVVALEELEKDKVKRNKGLLLTALVELKEMKQNKDVFTDADIAEKEAEVLRLK